MRPYRCLNEECHDRGQAREFWADEAVCPHCGADGRHPADADLIAPLTIIHFDETIRRGRGRRVRACDPAKTITTSEESVHAGSGVYTAVNCPACRESEAYQNAKKQAEG